MLGATMRCNVSLGPTPVDEECAEVGSGNYGLRAKKECRAYINQLKRIIAANQKSIPEGFTFRIKAHPHDFDTYYEVSVYHDKMECKLAEWIQDNLPSNWDDEAKKELAV